MKKTAFMLLSVVSSMLLLAGCAVRNDAAEGDKQASGVPYQTPRISAALPTEAAETTEPAAETAAPAAETTAPAAETPWITPKEETEKMLAMRINDTAVAVEWEQNASVEALAELCKAEPLVIEMSMYGGFEQVGPIGTRLPSSDMQTKTAPGDIVLYSSNQIVVFYGANSWAYTRLGRITDRSAAELAELLENGNVTISLSME